MSQGLTVNESAEKNTFDHVWDSATQGKLARFHIVAGFSWKSFSISLGALACRVEGSFAKTRF